MIRVLQVIGAMDRGGAETILMNLYRAMDRSRIQFDFLVHEQHACDYDEEIQSLGGRLFRVPRFVGTNLLSYRKLIRELFEEHPEFRIVHGHIGSSAVVYLTEANRAGRYTIAHSHAQSYERGLAGLEFAAVSYPTRFIADYFMACSQEAGIDRFGKTVVSGNKFTVVNNGIDTNLYACTQAAHEAAQHRFGVEGRPVFGHVGRFSEEKNHQFLLDVFDLVKKSQPRAVLLLAGRGPLEDELKQEVITRGLGDSVHFLGVCDCVPELLKAMDVFVFPSRKEGLSLASVEAQATGLPVIMSTGVPELAVVSSRVQRIPLADGPQRWAQLCLESYESAVRVPRTDACEEVRAHGFDISTTASWLEEFYLTAGKDASHVQ